MIKDSDKERLQRFFGDRLVNPVRLMLFTQASPSLPVPAGHACQWCTDTEALLTQVAGLSEKLTLEVRDFVSDAEQAAEHRIDKIPALMLLGERDFGVRFFGIPAGYEFSTLVEDLVDVSRGTADISPKTAERLNRLTSDVHLQVLISPTCPYCPRAVRLAHQMAIISDRVTADMIEIQEFPHLAQRYNVRGVPKTMINETESVEGAAPESLLLLHILSATGDITEEERAQFAHYQQ